LHLKTCTISNLHGYISFPKPRWEHKYSSQRSYALRSGGWTKYANV